ncbi:type I-E CRISPR-associated protein Cas7/Cse4/CasC [Streptomyces noursei]
MASNIKPVYIDFHVLQATPPSNINRGDNNEPKEAIYGGVRRPRASSQSWKRSTRIGFADLGIAADLLGTRSKRIVEDLAARVQDRTNVDAEAATRLAAALLSPLGVKPNSKKKESTETAYLLFYGTAQLDRVVDLLGDRAHELLGLDDKKLQAELGDADAIKNILSNGHPIDVALFGRMVADVPGINVDAACQVAHALATHGAELEYDFYTAVEDRQTSDEAGAGMMGRTGFNAAVLYRYASVGLHQLYNNLGNRKVALNALTAFAQCFTRSMPTGYGNAFGHRTLPQLVAITVREDQPVNLVTAFENPVQPRNGYGVPSAQALAAEALRLTTQWEAPAKWSGICHSFTTPNADSPTELTLTEAFGTNYSFPKLIDALATEIDQ